MSGPLTGIKIVELAGVGPGPYACMLLADAGADVLRLERARPGTGTSDAVHVEEDGRDGPHWDLLNRSRRSVGIDLKHPEAVALVLDLVEQADGLIEGFRPGVAERLGVGPEECLSRNPRLVYGRMTGWGQDGPMADRAGHDIDYIALSGALWPVGRQGDRPVPPLNLVGDFGGGGMLLAFGMACGLLEAARSGRGQVVDAAMTDGSASLLTMLFSFLGIGNWKRERGTNVLDSGAPCYEVYETADGKYFAVGALESKFYAELLAGLGLDQEDLPAQMDQSHWPELKERFAEVFRSRTRDEWEKVFAGYDACAVPVLDPWESPDHPHNRARTTFVEVAGVVQPAPAPRFSRTPSEISKPPSQPGADTDEGLADWGIDPGRVSELKRNGALG